MNNKRKVPRILLGAAASGSGKTLLTCGLLQALKNRNLQVASFKCGPDYIDPMFHSRVIGTKSRNLDSFFAKEDTLRYLLEKNARDCEISVIEGVMGYYDGLAGISPKASAYDVARITKTPESVCGSFCQGLCGIQRRQSDPWCDSESDIPNDVSAVKADHRRNPAGESVRVCSGGEGLRAGKPSSGSGDAGRNRRSA